MRLLIIPLLFLMTTACASSESTKVYIFPEQRSSFDVPTLTQEEVRLIIAHRLGVSQYHNLRYASKDTLSYINSFGGRPSFFPDDAQDDNRSHLVVFVEGVSSRVGHLAVEPWQPTGPAFQILIPKNANNQLISAMISQIQLKAPISCSLEDSTNPFEEQCWAGRTNIIQFNLTESTLEEFQHVQSRILRFVQSGVLDAMIIMVPESVREPIRYSHGPYDMPSRSRNRRGEEPMELPEIPESKSPSNASSKVNIAATPRGVIPLCHSSVDSCNAATKNCSRHGLCALKYGEGGKSCFTCFCKPTRHTDNRGYDYMMYWGGAACSKEDISWQFWLLASFSVVAISVVSWAISMMFAIGEEKLPGVIGAGVSGPKAR